MATGSTDHQDVTADLVCVRNDARQAEDDYSTFVLDAHDAGRQDIATFFEQVRAQNTERVQRAQALLDELTGQDSRPPRT